MSLETLIVGAVVGLVFSVISPSFRDIIFFARIGGRQRAIRISFKSIGPYLNTVVAIISLIIAIQAYNDSKESGPQQQAILEKTKAAIDSSTAALQGVLRTSNNQQKILTENLKISTQQLSVLQTQWQQEKSNISLKPNLQIECQYEYRGIRKLPDGSVFPGMTDIKSKFLDERNIIKSPFIFKKANLLPFREITGSIGLTVKVKNTGSLIAKNVYLTVNPLQYGIYLVSDSFTATGPVIDESNSILYNPGTVHTPYLTVYSKTNAEFILHLKVELGEECLDKYTTIEVKVYSDETAQRIVPIKFKVLSK